MLRLAGWWWIVVSILHTLYEIVMYYPQWQKIAQAGWINAVAPNIYAPIFDREDAFMSMMLSPFIYLIGELCLWAHRYNLVLPISVGIILLSTMLIGVFFEPVSGFWLGLAPSIMMLYSSKIMESKEN